MRHDGQTGRTAIGYDRSHSPVSTRAWWLWSQGPMAARRAIRAQPPGSARCLSHRLFADGRTAMNAASFLGAAGPVSSRAYLGWVAMVRSVSKAAAVGLAGSAW